MSGLPGREKCGGHQLVMLFKAIVLDEVTGLAPTFIKCQDEEESVMETKKEHPLTWERTRWVWWAGSRAQEVFKKERVTVTPC